MFTTEKSTGLLLHITNVRTVLNQNLQNHGSQPTQTLPSTLGSVAWSSRQSTCFSTDRPSTGSVARTLCSSDPRATDCIPGNAASFSNPSFSSSLTKQNNFTPFIQLITEEMSENDLSTQETNTEVEAETALLPPGGWMQNNQTFKLFKKHFNIHLQSLAKCSKRPSVVMCLILASLWLSLGF